jgi:hypothetical protein
MKDNIPFDEGEYLAEQSFLMNPEFSAVELYRTVIRIFLDRVNDKRMNGRCFVQNILMVELLEAGDELDLVIDFGGEFKYILRNPELKSGKVFSPDVKSVLHFSPRLPWEQISLTEFEKLLSRLSIISR